MKVHYITPYCTDKNFGRSINESVALIPDGDWVAVLDGDMMFLTPEWGRQIEEVVKANKKYSLIGCYTNRLGRPIQRLNGEFSTNHDVKHHYDIALEQQQNHWGVVEDVTAKKRIAGMFMLFPKSLWNEVKFRENRVDFDDCFCVDILRKGNKLGLIKGLYVYHAYRIWADVPHRDRAHLTKPI